MSAFWRKTQSCWNFCVRQNVLYLQGYESGDGYNSLIDTLKQQFQLDADVSLIRSELEKK
eukprot:12410515-Karenia_brevis.AAC.1